MNVFGFTRQEDNVNECRGGVAACAANRLNSESSSNCSPVNPMKKLILLGDESAEESRS
jgi:hypothetical protein